MKWITRKQLYYTMRGWEGAVLGDVGAVLGSQQSKSPSAAHHSLINHSLDKNHRASSTGHVLQGLLGESTDQYAVVDPQNK